MIEHKSGMSFKYGVSYSCYIFDDKHCEVFSPFGVGCVADSAIEAVSNELASITDVNRYIHNVDITVDFAHKWVGSDVELIGNKVVAVVLQGEDVVAVVFSDPILPAVW